MAKVEINDKAEKKPIVFAEVFAEKPGGGVVGSLDYVLSDADAVGLSENGSTYTPIKSAIAVEAAGSAATEIKVNKGRGWEVGDFIAYGSKSVAITAIDTTNEGYDLVTATIGSAVPKGGKLYQAKSASASNAAPVLTPVYLVEVPTGEAGDGGYVRLINGANVYSSVIATAPEVIALMKNINII